MSEQKTYVGNGKIKTFDNGGSQIRWSCTIEELEKAIAMRKAEGETWININICERREPSDKGMTHYGVLDTWKPTQQGSAPQQSPQVNQVNNAPDDFDQDIPF